MSDERTVEEWGQVRNAAHEAMAWTVACRIQIERFWAMRKTGLPDGDIDRIKWTEWTQAWVEAHFLVVAANQLRLALSDTAHADLLDWFPPYQEPGTDVVVPGATFIEHARNAQEHDDERGWFSRDYGFTHRSSWSDSTGRASLAGLRLPEFGDAVEAIHAELDARFNEASRSFDVGLARRLGREPNARTSGVAGEREGTMGGDA